MITKRPAAERGHANHGWLDTHHTFSFGRYHDPAFMGFRKLRVLNDDTVAGGRGFGTHGHRDMEIVSVVLDGALEHRDDMGTGSVLRVGDVQRMSAGRGVRHSEFNHSPDAPLHFLQIWIEPAELGIEPGYEERKFPLEEQVGRFRVIASPDARESSLTLHQDASIHSAVIAAGDEIGFELAPERHAWVHVATGSVALNGEPYTAGDGAGVSEESRLVFTGVDEARVLVFDLA